MDTTEFATAAVSALASANEIAVESGIDWLDARLPGWETKIDLAKLDLSSCRDCVLGQLALDLLEGQLALGLLEGYGLTDLERLADQDGFGAVLEACDLAESDVLFGFACGWDEVEEWGDSAYTELTRAWDKAISARLSALDRPRCQVCGEPCELADEADPELGHCHAFDANDNGDHTAVVEGEL